MESYIRTVVYANTIPAIALIIFLFFLGINSVFDRRQTRLFFISSIVSLFMIIIISLDFFFSGMSSPDIYLLRRITSFFNFALSPAVPLLLYRISKAKRPHWSFYAPLIINILICSISIFVRLVFYISSDNGYERGVLFFVPFLINIFYMLVLIFQSTRVHMRSKQVESVFLILSVALLILGMVLEIAFYYRFFAWNFGAMLLILYYLLLNIQSAVIDSLTGAYNRHMYDRRLSQINERISCDIALVDINNFKSINDLYGHDAGDRYLITFTNVLSQSFSSFASVFRIGGDEFVVISKKHDAKRFAEALSNARKNAMEHNIKFACGTVTYDPSISIQQAVQEADKLMYQEKKEQHSSAEQGEIN